MKVLQGSLLCIFVIFSLVVASPYGENQLSFLSPIRSMAKNLFGSTYRLPNNSVPLRYDLRLKTDFDKGDFNFEGRAKIYLKTIESTKKITLHMKDLNIENIDLFGVDGSLKRAKLLSSGTNCRVKHSVC
jgi:hypothetical protein